MSNIDNNTSEQNIVTSEQQELPRTNIKELIIDSVISSQNFYLNNLTKKIAEPTEILEYKIKLKLNSEYKGIISGEIENEIRPNKYGEKLMGLIDTSSGKQPIIQSDQTNSQKSQKNSKELAHIAENVPEKLLNIPEKYKIDTCDNKNDNLILSLYKNQTHVKFRKNKSITPDWHAPWKLYRVISGHTGWVRCIDVDPTNNWFVTGSNDRLIKFWDLATGKLKLSLTGHINTVRGVVISTRHPYLFSCGEDKSVKCWDLEQNKVVRHYHGHLSGVYCIALHPTLDILVTGGRDCVARVWDLRSRQQIFCLEGHTNTISSVAAQEFNPQIITGSHDTMIKLWDLTAGKCFNTLTHHKKSVRSMVIHEDEYTFLSGGCDNIKVWQCPEGRFLRNITGHNAIVNSIALNKDGVLVSGSDNGLLNFWDYKSGYNFQQIESKEQSGSLSAEAGIFAIKFDHSSTRMITAECDKTIKMWKEDDTATPESFPIKN